MKIKKIIKDDISNGPSFRCSVWVAGCPGVVWNKKTKRYDHCPGCFNSEAWVDIGAPIEDCIDEIIDNLKPSYVAGLSILGGEPMSVKNQEVTAYIVDNVRHYFGDTKSIWLWTGHIFTKNPFDKNRIPHTKWTRFILKNIDVIVDGPFIKDKFDIDLKYRGSSNQRVIKLKKS